MSSIGDTPNSVTGEDVEVVFDVLADLEDCVALKQRLEHGQGQRQRHLLGRFGKHVGAAVAEGDVAGIVGPEREADPGQIGAHRIEHRCFGVDRDQPGSEGPVDPPLQRFGGLDAFVGVEVDRGELRRRLACGAFARLGRGVDRLGRIELGRPLRAAGTAA